MDFWDGWQPEGPWGWTQERPEARQAEGDARLQVPAIQTPRAALRHRPARLRERRAPHPGLRSCPSGPRSPSTCPSSVHSFPQGRFVEHLRGVGQGGFVSVGPRTCPGPYRRPHTGLNALPLPCYNSQSPMDQGPHFHFVRDPGRHADHPSARLEGVAVSGLWVASIPGLACRPEKTKQEP